MRRRLRGGDSLQQALKISTRRRRDVDAGSDKKSKISGCPIEKTHEIAPARDQNVQVELRYDHVTLQKNQCGADRAAGSGLMGSVDAGG
jgi:hypothetical protein